MEKDKLIKEIDELYPTDCRFDDTNMIGNILLQKAIDATKYDWRNLPIEVLNEYHKLCVLEDQNGEVASELLRKGLFKSPSINP